MRSIRDCSVAVVGGAGFLGSHLVDHLIEDRNCRVLVVDNLASGFKKFVHKAAQFEHHDITGSEVHLNKLFRSYKIQFVFNLAAYPYVPDSFARPLQVADVNFMGSLKVINAAQEAGCEGVLAVSSAEIYPGDGGMISETSQVHPHSTYGCSKAAVDYFCQVAWRERQTPVIALRQFNAVGPRDILHPYVIPQVYKDLESQERGCKAVLGLGNNSQRDFIDSRDAMRIAVELLEKGQFGEVYNSGSGETHYIYKIAEMIASIMGFTSVEITENPDRVRPWELWNLQADCSKLHEVSEYRSQFSFEQSLVDTIKWYDDYKGEWPW